MEAVLLAVHCRRAPAGGVLPEVAALLDFATLADISGEWVHDGARRRGDSVWRASYRDGSGRSLVLFLEFQSTVDADMARRVLRNVGMATERLRRNRALDPDGRLRALCVVIHSGRSRWNAPGAARRVAVDDDGEVLSVVALPYAALDARRMAEEHLPARNLVSTLFELNSASGIADAAPALRDLGVWLGGLGTHAEPVRAAYAEWLATTVPTFAPEEMAALVERHTGGTLEKQEVQEEGMVVYTVWEDKIRRQIRRAERDGLAQGLENQRKLLLGMAARRFGTTTAARLAPHLADVEDTAGLERVGEWIVDCADGEVYRAPRQRCRRRVLTRRQAVLRDVPEPCKRGVPRCEEGTEGGSFPCGASPEASVTAEVLGYASGEAIRLDDEVVEMVNRNRHGRVVEVLQPASDLARACGHPEGGISVVWNDDLTSCFYPPSIITGPDELYFFARTGGSAEDTIKGAALGLARAHPEWTDRRNRGCGPMPLLRMGPRPRQPCRC